MENYNPFEEFLELSVIHPSTVRSYRIVPRSARLFDGLHSIYQLETIEGTRLPDSSRIDRLTALLDAGSSVRDTR